MAATLSYRLPLSCVRISGTETTKTDSVLGRSSIEREGVAELTVIADLRGPWVVELDPGRFKDTQASFKLTEDGRLTSASATVTGQGGTILSGLVGIATTAIAIGLRAGPVLAGALEVTAEAAVEAEAAVIEVEESSDDKRVEAEYLAKRRPEADARSAARQTFKALEDAHSAALADVGKAQTDEARAAALKKTRQLDAALAQASGAVEKAETLFKAWRAGTLTSTSLALTYQITLDELRMSDVQIEDDVVRFPEAKGTKAHRFKVAAAQAKVRTAWERLGVLVVVLNDPRDEEPGFSIPEESRMTVRVRFPRPVLLAFYSMDDKKKAQLEAIRPAMVVDGASRVETIEVNAGWFGKRSGGISFSAEGIPTGFDFGNSSEAAAAAAAFAGLPAGVATSLETVSKISDQLDALRNKGREYELARTKREVELQQQQMTKKGLDATQDDFAKLKRLEQEAEMLKHNTALGRNERAPDPLGSEIADLKRQVELLRLRQQLDRLEN